MNKKNKKNKKSKENEERERETGRDACSLHNVCLQDHEFKGREER